MQASRLLSICCLFSLSLLLSLPSASEPLKVGLGELDYPPFYFEHDSTLQGAAIEIAEAVSARAGYKLDYQRVPWKRLQEMLRVGSLDMVILYFKTPERAKDVVYTSEPHIYENSSVVIPKGMQVDYSGKIDSLIKHEIFYVRGYSHGKDFDHSQVLSKRAVNNENELLKRVTSGRPFLGVGNKPVLLLHAKNLGIEDKIDFLNPPFDYGKNYMAFSKKRADASLLAEHFSKAFSEYSRTPDYHSILVKHGFRDEKTP